MLRKIVKQSHLHKANIVEVLNCLREACDKEFTEDNEVTREVFLRECFEQSEKEHTEELAYLRFESRVMETVKLLKKIGKI